MAAFSAIAATIAILGTTHSVTQQRKASKQMKRANKLKRRVADVQANRERRAQVRRGLSQRASIENLAGQTGTLSSSGAQGGVSNVTAQESSNLAFVDQQQVVGKQLSIFNQRAADAQSSAAIGSAVSGVANQFAGEKGYQELGTKIKSIFRGK